MKNLIYIFICALEKIIEKFIEKHMIFLYLFNYCLTHELQLFPALGVAVENKDNSVIVTNGYIKTKLRIEMNLPKIDESLDSSLCEAKNKSTSEFINLVAEATTSFKEKIRMELDEFISTNKNINTLDIKNQVSTKEITAEGIKKNPLLCNNEGVTCDYFPVIDLNPNNPDEYMLRACYDSNLGTKAEICEVEGATTVCCSKKSSNNVGKCLTKGMEKTIAMIARHELTDTGRKHQMGHGLISQNRVNNYCIAVLSAEFNGKEETIGTYTEVTGEAARNLPVQSHRRRRGIRQRKSRRKRSIWSYYAQGGFLTSAYIDNSIAKVEDVMKANDRDLKEALNKNSKTLLTLQADEEEQEHLRTAVCSTTEELSKELVLSELKQAQSKLVFKADAILRTCANSEVPDEIDNTVLTKMCSALSDSKFCFGKNVRSLFRCKLDKPLITLDVVGIATILTLHIPISEDYSVMKFHTIGVPFISDAIKVETNVTYDKPDVVSKKTEEKSENLNDIFEKLVNGLREEVQRNVREVVTTHHFLEIKSLPDIVVHFNNDYISFSESSFTNTPWARIVDYSQNIADNNECVKAVLDGATDRITHFCELKLVSSNYPCIIRHLGDVGYLISSEHKTLITEVTDTKVSVFNSAGQEQCENTVCIIPVGPTRKSFSCGNRNYYIGQHEDVEVKVEEKTIEAIDLTSLRKRKSNVNDLLFTGFNTLDRTSLSREIFRKSTTIGTIISLLFALFIMCTVLRIGLYNTIQYVCLLGLRKCQQGRRESPKRSEVSNYRPRIYEKVPLRNLNDNDDDFFDHKTS